MISCLVRLHRSRISSAGISCRQETPPSAAVLTPISRVRADILRRRRNIFNCSKSTPLCCFYISSSSSSSSPPSHTTVSTPPVLSLFSSSFRISSPKFQGVSQLMSPPLSLLIPAILLLSSPPTAFVCLSSLPSPFFIFLSVISSLLSVIFSLFFIFSSPLCLL